MLKVNKTQSHDWFCNSNKSAIWELQKNWIYLQQNKTKKKTFDSRASNGKDWIKVQHKVLKLLLSFDVEGQSCHVSTLLFDQKEIFISHENLLKW